jgi:S1-C subfamily serine protease
MARVTPAALAGLLLLTGGPACGDEGPSLKDALTLQEALQGAIRKAEPSIACILVNRSDDQARRLDDPEAVPESYGSGVVIGEKGLILTNYHVIRDAAQIFVRLPGRRGGFADPYAADPRSDLSVLRLREVPTPPLPEIRLGDGDHVRKGQLVLSIANPFAAGFHDGSPSASWGIISNIRRRAPGRPPRQEQDRANITLHHYGTLLQTDARLNLGCSGGALIDLKGEMIGLTTAAAALTGTETAGGFAVPMTGRMRRIIQVLKEGREVEYGFLGVSSNPLQQRPGGGVQIDVVIPGSPAFRAGLRPYTTILRVDGQPVNDQDDLFLAIGSALAGSEVRLDLLARPQPVMVKLAKFYVPTPGVVSTKPPFVRGMRVDYASVPVQRDLLRDVPTGVWVREVQPGSEADKAHLQDAIITLVNDQEIHNPEEFNRLVQRLTGPLELTLLSRDENGFPRRVRLN